MREVLVKNEEFKDSPVGRIPTDWEVKTLGDCAFITKLAGFEYTNYFDYFQQGEVIALRVLNIRNGALDLSVVQSIPRKVSKQLSRSALSKGDLVISYVGTIGEVALIEEDERFHLAPNVAKISPNLAIITSRFLLTQILSQAVQKRLLDLSTLTSQPALSMSRLRQLTIALPSFSEQRRIAEILDTVDEAIARTSSLIIKLKQTKAGLLQDLLTRGLDENGKLRDPQAHPEQFKDLALGRIPQEWTVKEFGEYVAHLDSGWSPICEAEPVANGEWGVLKTTAVVWSGYNPSESKKLPSNLEPRYSAVVETDDILITRKGPRERVGVVVHIPSTPANLMMPDTVFRVRLKESSPLLPAFIPLTLGSVAVQQDWNRKKVGLAEAQVDINYGIVRETIIYIPPKSEQKYIIQILNTYDTRIRTEETYLNKLKLQKQGLMQDLLTGKVRVKNL
ncbi:restriction endonuclease subunit S [Nostoc sp. LPT]|uniref:restriction endonuclease subunit S n=1 Tax=Nostoc sp. LPT TaxID=2815387 RepID=UPI001D901D49|nr:restriction endonuclease subunit S [Nostoc sp. LPT]MBN4006204.1 restriction endonuclease subunit S [Nostoc sp. LPT]